MQSILCLDLSKEFGEAVIATINGNEVEICERKELSLGKAALFAAPDDATSYVDAEEGTRTNPLSKVLKQDLAQLQMEWGNSFVVLPYDNFLGLNIELPFGDAKSIERVLDLEVQDVVPFDTSDFLLQHRVLGPSGSKDSSQFDVFVGMLPRTLIKSALELTQGAGLEPNLLTTQASAAGAVMHLAPHYFKENCIILVAQDPVFSVVISIAGRLRSERVLHRDERDQSDASYKSLFTELRLTAAAFEQRYETKLECVYALGVVPKLSMLQQIIGRPVEAFTLAEVARDEQSPGGPGALATLFCQDDAPESALCNFRAREFSYSPRFQELMTGLKGLQHHALAAIVSVCFVVGAIYFARERAIISQQSAVMEQITKLVPGFKGDSGNILTELRDQETKLGEELGSLGSPTRVNPLDALASISKDLPDMSGLQINSVKIIGTKAIVEGVAPDLSAVATIEKGFKQNRKIYSKVTAQTGAASAASKGYRFSLEILLNQ